jgi:hypothetical protein
VGPSVRHLNVDQGGIGAVLLGKVRRLGRVRGEGDHVEVAPELRVEHGEQNRIVVGDQEARASVRLVGFCVHRGLSFSLVP